MRREDETRGWRFPGKLDQTSVSDGYVADHTTSSNVRRSTTKSPNPFCSLTRRGAWEWRGRVGRAAAPQGGGGVKIAGTSVVALEFVNVGLGSTHCLELADHCGADNHRTISTLAGAPLGRCVVAFVALLILESDCDGVGYVEPGQQMRQNSAAFSEHHVAFSYRMDLPLAGKLEVFAALHREKETQKHKLVKNNKNRQVGNWTLEHLETFGNLRRKTRVNNG